MDNPMTFYAAALQLGPAGPSIAETVGRILPFIDQAAEQEVKLLVLPELALTPYFGATIHDRAGHYASKADNDAAIAAVSERAARYGMAIVLPYAELSGNQIYNSMAFIDTSGKQVGTFRKMHIPGFTEPKPNGEVTIMEKRYFTPGDLGFSVHDTAPLKLGGLICYDRRFPEAYRSLVHNGAEIICIGYNTPVMPKGTLSAARRASELAMCGGAYSNGTFVIAAGKAGVENGMRYIGGSLIAGPDGMIMKKARSMGDELVIAEIDMDRQAAVRSRWAFDVNRRPTDYVMTAQA
jgi:predicted amidohydrolase